MEVMLTKVILAVITVDRNSVAEGGVPIFYAKDEAEQEKIAIILSRVTEGVIHELENGVKVLIKH